jgi:3-oxoacyl-[acyl-carrier protein] reductase
VLTGNGFAGQVAVVTGGSGGIGQVILSALRQSGATAINLDLHPPAAGGEWIECDVRDEVSISKAVAQIDQRYLRIDMAIHAAGISRDSVVWKLAVEEWDEVQKVNLRGAFLLIRQVVPIMRRGGGGRIVLIGSINGSRGKVGTAAYSASKAGLLGLARSVCRETGRFGILVNVIEPGWVRTPLTESVPGEIRAAALAETQLGEFAEPQDVAAAVLFLCGPGARRITGQILRVDAGQYL